MRIHVVAIVLLIGCNPSNFDTPDVETTSDSITGGQPEAASGRSRHHRVDHLEEIFDEVDGARVTQTLRELAGDVPVVVNGATITLGQRFDDVGRQNFRDYWTQTMQSLGLEVTQLPYQAVNHPRPGDNVEAVLRGRSADSLVVIVHYDSIGPRGSETANPGVDDDMSGMSIQLETARLFVRHKRPARGSPCGSSPATRRSSAGSPARATTPRSSRGWRRAEGFQLIAAVDDEQSGWNCSVDNRCGDDLFPAVDVYSCGGNGPGSFDSWQLGNLFSDIVASYSPLKVKRGCLGANSDHFAFGTIGVPALVYSEHNPFANPHFDREGGDTFDKIDTDYLISIARPGITFQAALAGVQK